MERRKGSRGCKPRRKLTRKLYGKRRKLVNFGKKSCWFTFTGKFTGKFTAKSPKNQRLQVYVNYVNQLYIE